MKKKVLIEQITNLLRDALRVFDSIDNSICFKGEPINLSARYVKLISIDNPDFYFDTYAGIMKYKESLNSVSTQFELIREKYKRYFLVVNRIKNINSIYAKIFRYNSEKEEKGEVQINKCLNDLFGFRVVLPIFSFRKMELILKEATFPLINRIKMIPSIKDGYRAYHIYLKKDNYCLRWELQCWLKRDAKKNRDAHSKHKQQYVTWEQEFKEGKLIEKVE